MRWEVNVAEQKRKQTKPERHESEEAEIDESDVGAELTDKIDDLLDEIDTVLEENAEEFVKNYVQKGGQ
jgi:ubiquitin-like protein Pup